MESPNLGDLVPIPRVWDRLDAVEERLLEVTEADDEFLTKIARHLIDAGGKRFRPLLAQVTAEFGPGSDGRPVEAGTAVELIHLGSLYHDDVIDESAIRRGGPSVNTTWGNTVAILAGDYLMARASEVAAGSLGIEAVLLLARTYAELCEGQMLELQLVDQLSYRPSDYYRVIGLKTASLIRTAARLGAMSANAEPAHVEAVSRWAWELGMVFQLTDDLLDLVATEDVLGKPVGSDLNGGKYTLAALYALEGPDGDRVTELLEDGRPYDPEAIDRLIEAIRRSGAIDRVFAEADQRVRTAEAAIAALPPGSAREVLEALGGYLLDRVRSIRAS